MDLTAALGAVVSVAGQTSEEGVLGRALELARALTGATYGAALLVGPDGSVTAVVREGVPTELSDLVSPLPRPGGLVGAVLGGTPTRLDRPTTHLEPVGFADTPMSAFLGVPVRARGRLLGGVYLTRAPGGGAFTECDETLADALASQAGLAVQGLRRLAAAEDLLDHLKLTDARADDLPTGDPAKAPVVQRLLAVARSALGMDLAFLSRLDTDVQTFTHVDRAAVGAALPLEPGSTSDASGGYCSLLLDGQIPASVPDVAAHPALAALPVTARLGVGAYCGVPVLLPDGSVYGTLCGLNGTAQEPPTAAQLEAVRTVARLLGERLAVEERARDAQRTRVEAFRPVLDGTLRSVAVQPIVDLSVGGTVGYEALSRFTDLAGTARRPDQVFTEAASLGVALQLELAAVRTALRYVPTLPARTYLSLNLSPQALLDPPTLAVLTAAPLDRLVVELTEHEQVHDYDLLLHTVAGLRERGLRLAVDDTGAGFASLQHITRLAPDIIKLDIAFVRDIDTDPTRRAVARAMASFAQELGAALVAEGIETPAELAQLRELGVPLGQGYHLGRPAPPTHWFARSQVDLSAA